jgi:hypothetical protein
VTGFGVTRMNTLGSLYSTRDIPAVTLSDTARVGHVRMRAHCENSKLDPIQINPYRYNVPPYSIGQAFN